MSLKEFAFNLRQELYEFFTNILALYVQLEGSREFSEEEDKMLFENTNSILKSIPSIKHYLFEDGLDKIVKTNHNSSNIMNFSNIPNTGVMYNIVKNKINMTKNVTEILIELQKIKSSIYRNIFEILEHIESELNNKNKNKSNLENVQEMCLYIRNDILGHYLINILRAFNMSQIRSIHNYNDLLEYNKKFINGELPSTFYYYNILIPDQSSEMLVQLANKGFFTVDGQGNENKNDIKQREYIEGFIQKKNVEPFLLCIEDNPHLYGYIVDMKGNIILDKQNRDWQLPNGSPDTKYSVTLIKENNTFNTASSFQSSAEMFMKGVIDNSGWWYDFKEFKGRKGKIHKDIENLYKFYVMDDRWVKEDDSLLEIILKCIPSSDIVSFGIVSSGGKRKTRKVRKALRKTRRH